MCCSGVAECAPACRVTCACGGHYLEEDAATEQLPEDAADAPDVYGVGVVLGPQEDLGGPVVLGDHLLGHRLPAVLLLHPATEEG